jgi:hypothetical protein
MGLAWKFFKLSRISVRILFVEGGGYIVSNCTSWFEPANIAEVLLMGKVEFSWRIPSEENRMSFRYQSRLIQSR